MAGSRGDRYYNIFLDYSLWFKTIDNHLIMKEDCFMLILKIRELGSIALASESFGISYRKAWNLIKKSENLLGFSLVKKHRGGKDGGHTELSPEGNNLVNAYIELKENIGQSIKNITKKFFNKINQKDETL
jgi:molybdate transport system regulatory protein